MVDLQDAGPGLEGHAQPGAFSSEVLKWTWAAFAVVALSGFTMFTTNARVYAHNTAFLIKLGLLAAAGVNMVIFHLTAEPTIRPLGPAGGRRRSARRPRPAFADPVDRRGGFAGRVVGFTTTGQEAKEQAPPPVHHQFRRLPVRRSLQQPSGSAGACAPAK